MLAKWIEMLLYFLVVSVLALSSSVHAETLPSEVRFAYAGGPRVWILGKIDSAFDKAFGTRVKWIPFNSGADVLTLFAAKEIDIARFGSSPAAAGIARGLPIEVIGTPEIIATSERLIARKGINKLKDLEGRTVAFPANSTAQYAFEVAVKLAGVERKKIKSLALKPRKSLLPGNATISTPPTSGGRSASNWKAMVARRSLPPATCRRMVC
jgi:taurine transport system substrate-binding protein